MTRLTSIMAYKQIKEEGLLPLRRLETLELIMKKGPCTRQEALEDADVVNPHSITASRFTELRDMGVIRELPKRRCRVTKRFAIAWEMTGMLPTVAEKQRSRPRNYKKVIKYLIDVMKTNNMSIVSLEQLQKSLEKNE